MIALMETGPEVTGPINIGNPNEFTIRELADQGHRADRLAIELVKHPLPADDPKQRQPNISLAKEVLGWEPKVLLDEGLEPRSTISANAVQLKAERGVIRLYDAAAMIRPVILSGGGGTRLWPLSRSGQPQAIPAARRRAVAAPGYRPAVSRARSARP